MPDFDAIIIGAGQAGPSLAFRLAGAGMKVAVVERHLVGGTCVNTGCTPTKALVASAYAARIARRAAEYGVVIGGDIGIDMRRVKARTDAIVAASRNGLTSALENAANITLYRSHARFASPQAVEIAGERLRAGRIFINVGGRALVPPMPGINEVPYLTNSSMMDVDFLPHHLIIVGGSYIGLEFGQMYRRFGSQVTIIEMAPRLVRHEDEDVSAAIKDIVEREGVDVRLNAECISLVKRGDEIVAKVDCTAGAPKLARICCWQSAVSRIPTIWISTKPGCAATSVATSSSMTDCKPLRRASGLSGTATARAPSPTPRTTISRSSPRICSTAIRAGSASASPPMPFTPTRHWAASA
jgi:pyruvate/2-oxoglutarate dehydrogenase complex dihydrolipoamide dehydrogenase (E3) component